MADEHEPIAPLPELDPPAIEADAGIEAEVEEQEVPVDTDPGDGADSDPDDADQEPEPPEFVTIERNGKQFQVPKELEGEFLMQSDYTKKTQDVSKRAKELDEREQSLAKQAEATEAELDARASLRSVSAQLEAYEKLTPEDWNAHEMQDPLGTRQHERIFQALKAQKAELEGKVSTAQTERTEKAQQDLAKRVQETLDAALTIIPGITAETRGPTIDKLVAFAASEGVPEQTLKELWSPTFLKILHKAQIGSLAISKQSAPKPITPKPTVAPLQTVRSATSPQASRSLGDIAKSDDMEAYAAARAGGRKR